MAQRSARSPVLILGVSVSCPLRSQTPLCPRCKSGPTVSRLQTWGGGSYGVPLQTCAAHGQPATTRAQPEAFLALPGEDSRRGRSLQWGDFQKSSPHCAGRSFERPM